MSSVDGVECLEDVGFSVVQVLRPDDEVSAVAGDLQWRVHSDFHKVKECLVEDQSGTIAVLDESLGHELETRAGYPKSGGTRQTMRKPSVG